MKFTTANEAIELLTRAVQERGEGYTYQPIRHPKDDPFDACMYVNPDGNPGCIVGLALHRAGVALDDMHQVESMPASLAVELLKLSEKNSAFSMVLDTAQGEQDARKTWGQALEAARKTAAEYPEIIRKLGMFPRAREEMTNNELAPF